MQIEFEGKKRVVFHGSKWMQQTLEQLTEADFPFKAKVVKEEGRYEFR